MKLTSKGGLAIGGAVAALVVAVVVGRDNGPSGTDASTARRAAAPGAANATIPVADVKLEALQQRHTEPKAPDRNLFRFESRPLPASPAPSGPATRLPGPPAPPSASLPPGPPPPPPIPLQFIGLVDAPSQAGRVAILSDGRGNVFYGKDGDIIEGRYKVLKVGPDAAELSYLDGRGRQTIRLTGQ